jgi:hypothetical protein
LLTHPTLDLLQEPGLACMAKAFGDIEASAEATALTHPEWPLCYSTARSAVGVTSARSPGCVMPGCAIKLQSKMSITAPPAVSIAYGCKRSLKPVHGNRVADQPRNEPDANA